jgi:uroporphyrin-III C-methyltransferase
VSGKVYLIGAGPGDPELLTVKAARLLQSADVVLHDALVPEEILALAYPNALVVDVGKRAGSKRLSQQDINRMMVHFAAAVGTVVRLKGGDPLIFGRAAEEMEALRMAGIEFEIVPGITAAVASAAQGKISLTDRDKSEAVIFLTAQRKDGKKAPDLAQYAGKRVTLAIYMPNGRYEEIADEAIAAGLSRWTPCLIVLNATRANQETYWTNLDGLRSASQIESPSLLIIGEVARPAAHATFDLVERNVAADFPAIRFNLGREEHHHGETTA